MTASQFDILRVIREYSIWSESNELLNSLLLYPSNNIKKDLSSLRKKGYIVEKFNTGKRFIQLTPKGHSVL